MGCKPINPPSRARLTWRLLKDGPTEDSSESEITYRLTVTNNGPSGANNIVIIDLPVPAAVLKSATVNCISGQEFTRCSIETLKAGSSRVILLTYTFQTPPDCLPTFEHPPASVGSITADGDMTNNVAIPPLLFIDCKAK